MLDLAKIDLGMLATAFEDHSPEARWFLDRETGEILSLFDTTLEEENEAADRDLVRIDPADSGESYADMADFVGRIRDPRARRSLERAIEGRGAFRRFKDALVEFPSLRTAWFAFRDARLERRSLEWLADKGLIERATADAEIERRDDPSTPETSGPFDAEAIAHDVGADLRGLYGPRLRDVVLFGSWAREDAHPESDIDLLVVLDEVGSPWVELDRMDELLWRRSLENATVISAVPVSAAELSSGTAALLHRVRAEGRSVLAGDKRRR